MPTAPEEALRNVPIFSGLSDEDLERLGRQMKERRFAEGADVTSEGAGAAGFFVIVEGNATVSVAGEVRTTLGPGDYFGEIALPALRLPFFGTEFVASDNTALWQVAWVLLQTLARRLR